jgi:hypothetical protein
MFGFLLAAPEPGAGESAASAGVTALMSVIAPASSNKP